MYQLTIFVREYLGSVGVSGVLHDRDEFGSSRYLADAPERFFSPLEGEQDPLEQLYAAVRSWAVWQA